MSYGQNQEQRTFDLEEGNFTAADVITQKGYMKGGTFASELKDQDWVEIYASADFTVQKQASGVPIGFIDGNPRGAIPKATASSGAYTRRYGNITLVGCKLIRVTLAAANAAISPGYYLAIDSTKNTMDKEEDTTSNIMALESADASSGATIWALEFGKAAAEAD